MEGEKMVSGSGICSKRVVVDERHHMCGRLASIVAKELLKGQSVVVEPETKRKERSQAVYERKKQLIKPEPAQDTS